MFTRSFGMIIKNLIKGNPGDNDFILEMIFLGLPVSIITGSSCYSYNKFSIKSEKFKTLPANIIVNGAIGVTNILSNLTIGTILSMISLGFMAKIYTIIGRNALIGFIISSVTINEFFAVDEKRFKV